MLRNLKNKIMALSILLAVPFMLLPAASLAQDTTQDIHNSICSGSNGLITTEPASGTCTKSTKDANKNANSLIKTVVNILSLIVGVIAVIMIIVAGLRYITSGGKDESVKGAKNTILYAVIGLVVVALAQLIVHFVLAKTKEATKTSSLPISSLANQVSRLP